MKKILSLAMIAFLHLVPLGILAQKAKPGPAAKTGRLEIKVLFEAEFNAKIDKKSGSYTKIGSFSSKRIASYKYSGTNKATSKNGYISADGSKGESTIGQISYEYGGKLIQKAPGGDTEIDDKGSFAGNISEIGTGSVTMAGQGDAIQEMEVSASAPVRGYFLKTTRSKDGVITDRTCTSAIFAIGIPEIPETQPDTSKPPELACAGRMDHSANAYSNFAEGYWSPMKSSGSFASGSYKFSFTGSLMPAAFQKNEPGDVQTYKETLTIEGNWLLNAGGAKKTGSLKLRNNFEDHSALLTPKYGLFLGEFS